MKVWQIALICLGLLLFGLLFIALLPGNSAVFRLLWKATLWIPGAVWSVFIICLVFFGPIAAGILLRVYLISLLDEKIAQYEELGGWGVFFLGFFFSLLAGAVWIGLVMLASHNHWLAEIFKYLGNWSGVWETPPAWWGVYAFGMSLTCFGIVCWSEST